MSRKGRIFQGVLAGLLVGSVLLGEPVGAAPSAPVASAFGQEQQMGFGQRMHRWDALVAQASQRFAVPEKWIRIVMQVESGGRTMAGEKQPIVSRAGAMGLMQLMPSTYRDMRTEFGLGADPFAPRDNIFAGAAYLHWLYEKYGYPKMFAAYNAGPKTVEAESAGERNLPDETQAYVSGIAKILGTEFPASPRAKATVPEPVDPNVTFTRPDGAPVVFEAASVNSIRAAMPNEYAPSVQTVVAMGEKRQGVREDVATVVSTLRSHGGKI